MELAFIALLFLSVYSYLVYAVLLKILVRLYPNPWKKGDFDPPVTIIISAYNEEKDIEQKVRNTLALDYPRHSLEIIVSSDGSTDRTNQIVKGFDDNRLILKAFPNRLGKTACLNKIMPDVKGEIVVFTDANSMFSENMLKNLVKNFYDESIGAATGWTKYSNPYSGEETTGLYARLEKRIKLDESNVSSCVGADGAIFAIRKELFVPLGVNDINDFIIPLNVIKQGKRVILDDSIFCVEETTTGAKNIFSRQVRITTRTSWAIRYNIDMLNIVRFGSFSFFLLSHKVLRLLAPFFVLSALMLNIVILKVSFFYFVLLVAQLVFFLVGLMGILGILKGSLASICKYFLITLAAQFVGCLRMVVGIRDIIWTPRR